MTKVSVVIPCYNAEPFLAQTLESALAQTRPVHEVIVVDDWSTDGSLAVAARYPVRVLRTPSNQGPSAARNVGIAAATGDVIAFLDSDDWWLPEHCATLVSLLERHPEAGVAGSAARYVGARAGVFTPLFPAGRPANVFRKALRYTPLPQMTGVVRTELVRSVGGYDLRHRGTEDFDLWLRLSLRTSFVCTHAVTACYRWHAAQLSSAPLQFVRGTFASRRQLYDRLVAQGDTALARIVRREIWLRWVLEFSQAGRSRDSEWMETVMQLRAEVPPVPPLVRGALRLTTQAWEATPHWLRNVLWRSHRTGK